MSKKCEHCGMTKWEEKQLNGWIASLQEEIEQLKRELETAYNQLQKMYS